MYNFNKSGNNTPSNFVQDLYIKRNDLSLPSNSIHPPLYLYKILNNNTF